MRIAIILDVPHSKDTPGKRSPDGKHREYLWGRGRIAKILSNILRHEDNDFSIYAPFLYDNNEPGLTNRVRKYNEIAITYDKTFVLSIHNDAFGNDWGKPHGVSVWTSKGETDSDNYATMLFKFLQSKYPNEKFRAANWIADKETKSDPDWEANFTVLAGNKKVVPLYDAVLLEWLFQTNKNDVEKLMNPKHNEYFEDMITQWILNTFNHV